MRRVEGWGRPDAKLIIVGEAPGPREEEVGQPFVGPAGYRLTEWMTRAGLSRQDAWIDNVYQYRPVNNKIDSIDRATLEQWMGYLHERLATLTDPWLIVPTGNYALYALTGKGKVHWHLRDGKEVRPGILDWRGSLLEYTDLRGRHIKCIPTIHPAATFRQPTLERLCLRDWERIAAELQFRELRRPVRDHDIRPSLTKLEALYLEETSTPNAVLAIDIENPRTTKSVPLLAEDGTPAVYKSGKRKGHPKKKHVKSDAKIVCVGFSLEPSRSLTVPVEPSYWGSDDKCAEAWSWIKKLCEAPVAKVLHNGLYDAFFLLDHRISLSNWLWDTLFMHHCLDASAEHDLATCASVDTREPYWKSEAKDPEEAAKYYSNWSAYLVYNGKDCCVTRELFDVYHNRLSSEVRGGGSALDFYLAHYADLYHPLLDLTRHGIRVDQTARQLRLDQLTSECTAIQQQLETLTGVQLYGKKSLSGKKLQHYLYEVLHLSKQYRRRKERGERTVTVDEVAVRHLVEKNRDCVPLQQAGPLILEHRRKRALLTFYRIERMDDDGRFRSGYSLNTEAGRLSSSRNPRGTGSNAQNVDREARDIFLADDGCIGVEVDASQAEARIDYLLIYMLTGDRAILDKARLRPDEYDQHTENAATIFNVLPAQVTKEQRRLGKEAVHAAFRDEKGETLANGLLKQGYVYTPEECDKLILSFRRRLGEGYIEELFRWVRRRMLQDYYLENTWGRRLYFRYDRLDAEAYRRGYSFDPQSEVADLMNQRGLKPLHQRGGDFHINAHVHDSLFLSVKPDAAYDVAKFLVDSLERPRTYYGIELSMPCTVRLGRSWKTTVEFLRLPDQTTFDHAVHAVMEGGSRETG